MGHIASGGQHSFLVASRGNDTTDSENKKDDHDIVYEQCPGEHCQKTKHSKHPFKSYGIRSSAPFEIIYSDSAMAPFLHHTMNPNSYYIVKYFVTFTDDFTRFTSTCNINRTELPRSALHRARMLPVSSAGSLILVIANSSPSSLHSQFLRLLFVTSWPI